MKLLFMSLALFFGAVLAITTDAASTDLKKDGDTPFVRRSLKNQVQIADAELKCQVFETFDNLARGENNLSAKDGFPGLTWSPRCDEFEPLDKFLCPTDDAVAAICSAKLPYENPAVLKNYCIPTFSVLRRSRRDECNMFCANYVSAARGGCCDIDCTPSASPSSSPSDEPSLLPSDFPSLSPSTEFA